MNAVRSEALKLRSVRSTQVVLATTLVLGLGIGLLDVLTLTGNWPSMSASERSSLDPVAESFAGFDFADLAFGALGVLAISSEYSTGLVDTTLASVPRRLRWYVAKALVVAVCALVVGEAAAFAAFGIAQAVLSGPGLEAHLGDPHVVRAVSGAGLYLAVVTLVGLGLGALIRHTAGALAVLFGLVFLSWPVARALEGVSQLPDHALLVNAGSRIVVVTSPSGPHGDRLPGLGLAYVDLALYLAVFLTLGAWRTTRDP